MATDQIAWPNGPITIIFRCVGKAVKLWDGYAVFHGQDKPQIFELLGEALEKASELWRSETEWKVTVIRLVEEPVESDIETFFASEGVYFKELAHAG